MTWAWRKIKAWEKRYKATFTHDIVDPAERRKSRFYTDWVDHGVLRRWWHNHAEIAPGVHRSNHPDHARLAACAARGIPTILNLRGATKHSHYRFEVESCDALGLRLVDLALSARKVPTVEKLRAILDVLDRLQPPYLMHCKSGADRTGLVSAIYLIHVLGRPPQEAKKMLSLRFWHLKFTSTGIQDHVIDLYARRVSVSPIAFREWVETEYDPEAAARGFAEMGFWERLRL